MNYEVLNEQTVTVESNGVATKILVLEVRYFDNANINIKAFVETEFDATDEQIQAAIANRYTEISAVPERNFPRSGTL